MNEYQDSLLTRSFGRVSRIPRSEQGTREAMPSTQESNGGMLPTPMGFRHDGGVYCWMSLIRNVYKRTKN